MITIVFYSYKGGTGRSLLLSNYARYLVSCNKDVFIIDSDLEAPGLHHKFSKYGLFSNFEDWINDEESTPKYGLCDYILYYQENKAVPVSLHKFCHKLSFSETNKCFFMPAGKAPSERYGSKVLDINWKKLFSHDKNSIGFNFFRGLQRKIEDEYEPDFLLIDSRTGITDIGSVVSNFLADSFVCLFLNNDENIEGTKRILTSFREANKDPQYNGPDKILCLLSRIPAKINSNEDDIISKIKEKLQINKEHFFCIHNEPALQLFEELRFGSEKTLGESATLRDYLRIFQALDDVTIEESPYFELIKYLDLILPPKKTTSSNVTSFDYNAGSNKVILGTNVVKNIEKRSEHKFRYTDFSYVKGDNYKKMSDSIINELLEYIDREFKIDHEKDPIPEVKVNWDLLPLQMQSGKFDFCTEPYYQTDLRSISTGIIQFGWLESYTCFFKSNETIRKEIIGKNIKNKKENKIEEFVKSLIVKYNNMQVGYMGETATTFEVTKCLAPIISGENIEFLKTAEGLWNWYNKDEDKFRLIICDHIVACQINELAKRNKAPKGTYLFAEYKEVSDEIYKQLVFSFNKSIPVGFLFPQGDTDWRGKINNAFGEVLKRKEILWGDKEQENTVSNDLYKSGVLPLQWEDLKKSIISGKKPEDAKKWIDEIGGKKNEYPR